MTKDDFRVLLESELAWRQEEMAFLKNQINNIDDAKKDKYRKSLVIMLYSHMEGFVKISLETYVQYINTCNLKRNEVSMGLMTAGMHKEFLAYENLDRKCEVFKRDLPEDSRLHRFFRRVDFVENLDDFKNQILYIEDNVIDTESNLWHIVLQKNLYKIGLPLNLFDGYQRDIDALVNRRNSIAHGNSRAGVGEDEYSTWEHKVINLLSEIMRMIYDYVNNEKYLV